MPQLPNPKHEAFAYSLAKGMTKTDAYVHAGYNDSPSSATRLSQKPEVVTRVEELRGEMMKVAHAIIESPSEENAMAMAAHGLTLEWCMNQFKDIAEKAKSAGQFAPANAAIKNIQSIIEMQNTGKGKGEDAGEPLIKLSDATEFAKTLMAFRTESGGPTTIDITPPDEMKTIHEVFDDTNN